MTDDDESVDVDLSTRAGVAPVASLSIATAALGETSLSKLPQQLGRYTLTRRLGIGGMAEVFLAEQAGAAGFKKACVVKRMLAHLALQPKYVEMFLREAHLAATLHHPNIVQIWDLGEVDGQFFIAMEYIDGLPLNRLARTAWRLGRSLPTEVICCALADAAEGLVAAHEHRAPDGSPAPIIHRDISPDNLMMDRDGVTRILDFGIARAHDSEQTQTGELKGKVPFMPLEQLRGERIDTRADMYALGVTAYWLLTGKRPYAAATDMALIEAIATQKPAPPIEINTRIPPQLNELVMHLLAKEREQRVGSARDVVAALEHVLVARKTVVAPFIKRLLDEPRAAEDSEPISAPSGFLPSTPHSDVISAGWQKKIIAKNQQTELLLRDAAAARAALDAGNPAGNDAPFPAPVAVAPAPRKPIALFAGIAVALVAVGALAVVALTGDDAPIALADAGAVAANVDAGAPVATLAALDAGAAIVEPVDPVDEPVDEPEPEGDRKVSKAAKRDVVVKGPATVQWFLGARSLGSGSRTLKVPASTKQLVAVDKKTGGRTKVTIGGGGVDYGALPRGKLQPRARPFADVFLGGQALGSTPFPAVDVVAGSYVLTFKYKGKEIKKTVIIEPGAVARPAVDFVAP